MSTVPLDRTTVHVRPPGGDTPNRFLPQKERAALQIKKQLQFTPPPRRPKA